MRAGDHVHVASLGKGIIREVRKSGRYLVEIKGRTLLVNEPQLALVDERKLRAKRAAQQSHSIPDALTRAHVPSTIDLHGMTTDEAVSALDRFLNDAILAGLAEVRVIHGRSGGRLKAAVHGRLKGMAAVASYRVDAVNPGVTLVML
jgi:DNA mismatch repair protein MutS2